MMLKSLAVISLLAISFVPIYAEPQVEISGESTPIMSGENDGYWYNWNFVLDTNNQTIALQSVDFIINNTAMSLYDIGNSLVYAEGQTPEMPLSGMSLYRSAYNVDWFYNYTIPETLIPASADPIARFNLDLSTHFEITEPISVKVQVHYITSDGKDNTTTSSWIDMNNNQSTISIKDIPNWDHGSLSTPQPYNHIQDKNQKIINQNQIIENQNAQLIMEQMTANRLLALNFCKDIPDNGIIFPFDQYGLTEQQEQCVKNIMKWAKND